VLFDLSIQNEQLQKTNQELDRFVYSVSHDLRAPLASSLGLVELSKGESDIEKLRHYNLLKEKTLRRLDDYVTSLLNFSRNYRVEIGHDEIDFEKIIEESVAFNKPYGNNELKLVVKIDVNQTGVFIGDSLRLRIVLNNLISNALKYHNENAQEQLIAIAVSTDEKKAILKVRDNGIGIANSKLNKVFDMFYRASETAKGSGLGLYITKEIVEKMGGKITVDSILESGTTFVVELPNYKK
jgi:signal transduction histidine kinase